jgi:general secretion pathway protein A
MYNEFFGLTGKPFQLSPDARFFYPSKEHSRALSFLQYGLSQGDGFIVITGDVGTGKTTLVQTLLAELDPREAVVANLVTTQLDEDDLVNLVVASFGLRLGPSTSKAVVLRDLEHFFIQKARESKRVLLIVDEAQNLPTRSVEELRMLSNFQYRGRPLLQVFLLGQEEFRDTLLSAGFEQLRQRVIATYHLNPLDADETRTYIEHRLARVGWHNDPQISDAAFHRIYAATQGVPRRVNNLCDRLMLFAYLEELHALDEDHVRTVADEIGAEFLGSGDTSGSARRPARPPLGGNAQEPESVEAVAKMMFDKANVQQRLSALERNVETLGYKLKDDMATIQDLLRDIRDALRGRRQHHEEEAGEDGGERKRAS